MTVNNIRYLDVLTGTSTTTPTIVEGSETVDGQNTLMIADLSVRELLEQMLIEMKKINILLEELL